MGDPAKKCFTCLTRDSSKYFDIHSLDADQTSYYEKLKACMNIPLVEYNKMEICWVCTEHLRVSYKFRETVLSSQQTLKDEEDDGFDTGECKDDLSEFLVINDRSDSLGNETEKESDNADSKDKKTFLIDNKEDILATAEKVAKQLNKQRSEKQWTWKERSKFIKKEDDEESEPPQENQESQDSEPAPEVHCCAHCDKEFLIEWKLRRHLNLVHKLPQKYVCSYCNREFKVAFLLKEHLAQHTGEKKYSCPICEKRFSYMSSQQRHIKTHDRPPGQKSKKTPFLCSICGRSFPYSNALQRHVRVHLGIRNYACSVCGRKFGTSTHLNVHMRTHTGEKPYICDYCGECFSLRASMLKHITKKHENS